MFNLQIILIVLGICKILDSDSIGFVLLLCVTVSR